MPEASKAKAGRKRSIVWECFLKNPTSIKRRALCRFCGYDVVANPIRMVGHVLRDCRVADEEHKQLCKEYQNKMLSTEKSDQTKNNESKSGINQVAHSSILYSHTSSSGSNSFGELFTPYERFGIHIFIFYFEMYE
jgi:hypothetical protein